MKMKLFVIKLMLLTGLSMFSLNVSAQSLSPQQEQDLIAIEQLLRENPAVIGNIRDGLEHFVEQQKAQQSAFETYYPWLYESGQHPVIGDPNAKHSIVIFTDYNCPFCKKLEPGIERIVKNYPSVNVINVIVPLRQQGVAGLSTNSALYGLNVWLNAPEDYYGVHTLLMKKSGMHDASSLRAIAKRSETQSLLKTDNRVEQIVTRNMEAFRDLGFRGTPTIMIGVQWVPGYIEYPKLEALVKEQFNL